MTTVCQVPEPPADAYTIMEGILPASYFRSPPPPKGIRLVVTGADRRSTFWHLPEGMADPVIRLLSACRVRVVLSRYRDD